MFWVSFMFSWCFCGVLAVVRWCCGGIKEIFWPILHTGAFTYRCTQKKIHIYTRLYTQKLPTQIGHKTSHFDVGFGRWTRVSSGNGSFDTSSAETNCHFTSIFRDQQAFRAGTVHSAPAELQFHPSFFAINTCFLREKFIAHRPHRILTSVFADRRVFRTGRARLLNCNLILQCLTIDRRFAREGCVSQGSTRIAVPPRNGTL